MPFAELLDRTATIEFVGDDDRDAMGGRAEAPRDIAVAVPCSVRPADPDRGAVAASDGREALTATYKVRFGWGDGEPRDYDHRHALRYTDGGGRTRRLRFVGPVRPYPRSGQWVGYAREHID